MAEKGLHLNSVKFSCSICLDPLKDPATIPCGHSYCMICIQTHWDGEVNKGVHSCPQCRMKFTPRPVLQKNVMLAELVEDLKDSGLPETDLAEKQKKRLEVSRRNIQQGIQERERYVKLLQQEEETINVSADKAVEDSEKIFSELILLLQKRSSDVKQQVRSQQQTEVSRVRELQGKLEQEMAELKRKDAELEQLSHTEDHNQFLHNYPSVSALSESTHSSSIHGGPQRYFEDVTAAVSESRDKLQDILRETWTVKRPHQLARRTEGEVLEPLPEPKTRAEILQYYHEVILDPNTAHTKVFLSEGNRKAIRVRQQQPYLSHPSRFTSYFQVLSRESLTGRCYWEVEWRGREVYVAVTYTNISRKGSSYECLFGFNDKSWALQCDNYRYVFLHDKVKSPVSGPVSSRVGVYLDHRAGILSFYSISETMTLLHRVQTTFTQLLYAGVRLYYTEDSAELIVPVKR